jgi:hypothetical protein
MSTIEERIRVLEVSNRRQRYIISALSATVVGAVLVAATRPVGDATFDKVTCKSWAVVDSGGVTRIEAFASEDFKSGIYWRDPGNKLRIDVSTQKIMQDCAHIRMLDGNSVRIAAEVHPTNEARLELFGPDKKLRFLTATHTGGIFDDVHTTWFDQRRGRIEIQCSQGKQKDEAAMALIRVDDPDGTPRVGAGTRGDGQVLLPVRDLK